MLSFIADLWAGPCDFDPPGQKKTVSARLENTVLKSPVKFPRVYYFYDMFYDDADICGDSRDEQLKTCPIHWLLAPHVIYHVSLEPGQRTINSSSALRSIIAPLLSSRSAQPTTRK